MSEPPQIFCSVHSKLRKFRGPQRRFAGGEKLVELRRAHRRAAEHGVGLATVVNVVLEQMQQQTVHPFALDGGAAMHGDDALQSGAVERFHDGEQAPIHRGLCFLQRGNGLARLLVRPGVGPERAAFHRIDVEVIDDQDVIERGAQARKEAGSLRGEFVLRQPRAGGEQPMVCPGVVVRHGAVGKHVTHWRCRTSTVRRAG